MLSALFYLLLHQPLTGAVCIYGEFAWRVEWRISCEALHKFNVILFRIRKAWSASRIILIISPLIFVFIFASFSFGAFEHESWKKLLYNDRRCIALVFTVDRKYTRQEKETKQHDTVQQLKAIIKFILIIGTMFFSLAFDVFFFSSHRTLVWFTTPRSFSAFPFKYELIALSDYKVKLQVINCCTENIHQRNYSFGFWSRGVDDDEAEIISDF